MRSRDAVRSGRVVLWLAVALCLLVFALVLQTSNRLAYPVFAAAGAMFALPFAMALPALLRRKGALWQAALRMVRRKAKADFDTLPVPLMRFAADGTVVGANAAARDLIGDGLKSSMAHEIFEDLGRPVSEWLGDVASGRNAGGSEVLRLRHLRDSKSFVQMTARRFAEDEVLAVLQDATAMKRLEAQFTQSQKMQAVGQLAGGIAHDFNNLLTAITGHCDLLLLRHRPDDLDHEDLQQILQNAYRAGALVKQLLAFSRKQTMVLERIDLTEALGELTHLLNRLLGGAVRLDLHHADVPVAIRVDKAQFEQVIINLAVNARDAMPLGGALRIRTDLLGLDRSVERDRARVPAGRYAVIYVTDSGTGIAPDIIGQIFEPFFTTKRVGEGTGLGLATVYGIVKQSGGFIFVNSSPGAGTEFELWFPAYAGEAVAAPKPTVQARPNLATEGVVLLVEDEVPVRAFAARALRLRGLTVLEAESGEQALEMMRKQIKVDMIVTDVALPGLTGPEWVAQARTIAPETPVLFISGYAAEAQSEAQARLANSAFLAKPFSLAQLTETVTSSMPDQAQSRVVEGLSVS